MIYHSTYKESLGEYISQSLSQIEIGIFNMLYRAYNIKELVQNSYFEILRVGDGKYTLTVQKYVDDTWSVKFKVNHNFGNKANRFTK